MKPRSLKKPALYVEDPPANFDPYKVQTDGHSYIHQVRWEASRCEDVVTVPFEGKSFERTVVNVLPDCQAIPSQFLPDISWQNQVIEYFKDVRCKVIKCMDSHVRSVQPLPKTANEKLWHEICVNGSTAPLTRSVAEMHSSLVDCLLEYNVEWLQEQKILSPAQGQWIYALLARVDEPLCPDTCSTLRSLARECAKVRAQIVLGSSEPDVTPYNLIICLVANYFRQMDLADVVE